MGYQALYRAYRPARFGEVIGQPVAVRILRNQVISGRIGHAYLFAGPRGVGKTSVARIFARAINCLSPRDGEACGECAVCPKMAGENMDILEIDAASNNSVENIRGLRENVGYSPAVGRYRVYIIDEAHMLSASAFNALLKTLEEPPAHGVFILATTQPQKLPDTVVSRCQRFDFARIATPQIAALLRDILANQRVVMEDRGITAIARAAQGGLRDALSLLDQCMAAGESALTASDVYSLMGSADQRYYFALSDAMLSGDAGRALKGLDTMIESGADIAMIASDLMRHFRDIFIAMASGAETLGVDDQEADKFARQGAQTAPGTVLRVMEILSRLEGDLRYAAQPRVLVELAVARCCRQETGGDYTALLERVEKLEAARKVTESVHGNGAGSPRTGCAAKEEPDNRDMDDADAGRFEPDPEPPWDEEPDSADSPPWETADAGHGGETAENTDAVDPAGPGTCEGSPENGKPEAAAGSQAGAPANEAPDLQLVWNRVIAQIAKDGRSPMLVSLMQQARPASLDGALLEVVFPPGKEAQVQQINNDRNSARLSRIFSDALDQPVRIKAREEEVGQEQRQFILNSMRDLSEMIGGQVTVQFDEE